MGRWTGGFAAVSRPDPGPSGVAFWLRTPSGLLACQFLERIGHSRSERAEAVAVAGLMRAAHEHRASPLFVHGLRPSDEGVARLTRGLKVTFSGECDDWARRLALSLFPPPPSFGAERLTLVGESIYLARGSRDYYVDVLAGTCTCPAFSFGRRPCKHLEAALGLDAGEAVAG